MPKRLAALAVLVVLVLAGCSRSGGQQTETAVATLATESIITTEPPPAADTTIAGDPGKPIADVLTAADDLSTMKQLLDAAGMMPALAGKGANTLFVPTNAAFEKLPEGVVASLRQPANREKLRTLLRYHLVIGSVPTSQMLNIMSVMTYQGGRLKVTAQEGTVTIDGTVTVSRPDVPASNGLIDVVDGVLWPQGLKP